MRALQITAWKQPPEFREVPDPDPAPGEVVVRVAGAGACHSDLHLLQDFDAGQLPWGPPFTLGHENAGWVHALGEGVGWLEVGQPVAVYGPWGCGQCKRCRVGMENYCERQAEIGVAGGGLGLDGGMAPLLRVPSARLLVPLDELDPVAAAPLTDAGLTPYHAITRALPLLGPGSTAVVIGVGGLGHLGVQILSALTPARIVAVDTKDDALALATDDGAHHGVAPGPDAEVEIRELTKGKGADAVFDFVGVDATMALGAVVSRPLGTVVVVGIGGGSYAFGFFTIPYEVSLVTTYWGSYPELTEVIALAERGLLRPHVTRFPLDEAPAVYQRLARGEIEGRAVVVPSG
jgi:propanol-preferring alcohol dehydrogenase